MMKKSINRFTAVLAGLLFSMSALAGPITEAEAMKRYLVEQGIPEEDIERIFERFYRVDKSRSRQIGGTGLGLSIVKHACILNNATVDVRSVLGEGSEFTVTFNKV